MSRTASIGVVGPSYWSYMAAVMADHLAKVLRAKRTDPDAIPRGVYADAQKFFTLVLDAIGDQIPSNPPASMNAYKIAADAIKESVPSGSITREQLASRFNKFASVLNRLREPGQLNKEEIGIAIALKEFFERLHFEGEEEAYQHGVQLEAPPLRFGRL